MKGDAITDFIIYNIVIYYRLSYLIVRHVFLSGNLTVLSGRTVILLTPDTINIIYIISRC